VFLSIGGMVLVPATLLRVEEREQRGLARYGLAVVRGRSMLPALREGDRLLVRYGAPVRPGSLVVARFADGALTVKRAVEERRTASGGPGWWLLSDNATEGVDSRHRGPVPVERIGAVVVARLWPSPRLGRHLRVS
jgi:phage repressor protein C with HTH and peptisase S24 domain